MQEEMNANALSGQGKCLKVRMCQVSKILEHATIVQIIDLLAFVAPFPRNDVYRQACATIRPHQARHYQITHRNLPIPVHRPVAYVDFVWHVIDFAPQWPALAASGL